MYCLTDAYALCYRIFDVADAIDLEHVRSLVTESRRLKLMREGSEYVQLSSPPLAFDVGVRPLWLKGGEVRARVGARVFEHGAISIVVKVPLEKGATFDKLVPVADELYDSPVLDALAREEVERLKALLAPAFASMHRWAQHESYTVLLARQIEGNPTAKELLQDPALARLLLGEVKELKLSQSELTEVLEHHHSYTETDLVVIEWNATFLYEPSGSDDLVDLLEIANAQLLELRYYDEVLDQELARAYDGIADKRSGSLLSSPYRQLSRDLMRKVIELSAFIERIENALKIVGDVYLARVYELAVSQLRITQWTEQVSRKHRLLQQTYALFKSEVDHDRALTLEVMVVVLIFMEIMMALFQVTH